MKYRSYADLSSDIKDNIDQLNGQGFDLVVGIPRSGMVPAYMVSLMLNISCVDFATFVRNGNISKGITRQTGCKLHRPFDARHILLMDDSIQSGKSLAAVLQQLPESYPGTVTTAVVYSSRTVRDDVDIVLKFLPPPRVFEWNIFHHNVVNNACFDIDGVLCFDPEEVDNDDGERYLNFVTNARPKHLPTGRVKVVVTNRLEKYRFETEQWLARHGVKYEQLLMLDLPDKAARRAQSDYFSHKVAAYANSGCDLFYESDYKQAVMIANRTSRFVYCVDLNQMIAPNTLSIVGNNKFLKTRIRALLANVPPLRWIYLKGQFLHKKVRVSPANDEQAATQEVKR
ncbi:phosphoribosyltransferase family protein [Ferrimonas pelagia]|uniref:Phosphoribosyltransferase family protein n=1 Tax=Ferrimonas pelagia TaxID=1177826 RepID=A0ABP9ETN1_9GAMM